MRKEDANIACCVSMDKKPIHIMTTAYPNLETGSTIVGSKEEQRNKVQYPCPPCVQAYNLGMGGVNQADQTLSYYTISLATHKWSHRFFFVC